MRRTLVLATLVATVTTLSVATAGAQGDDTEQFCNVNWKVSGVFNSIPDEPTDAQIQKIDQRLNTLFDQAEASVPAEIQAPVSSSIAIFREQGIQAVFEDPTLQEQLEGYGQEIDGWAYENCDYQTVDVTATEYEFSGIPKKLKPGRTIFKLTNDGAELHEIVIFNIKTKTPLKTLLKSQKRAEKESTFLGATFVAQDASAYAYANLKKGRGAAVCFIPVGATDPSANPEDVHGPPHFTEGMAQEFQVA